jgi:hypothetical protein
MLKEEDVSQCFNSFQLDAEDVERHVTVQSNIALDCTVSQVIK